MSLIVIIDPFSSCDYIYERLKKTGLYTLVLISNCEYINLDKIKSYDYDFFEVVSDSDDACDKVSHFLQSNNYDVEYILNGSDDSSYIAEELIKQFIPEYKNGPNALLRTQKFEMIEFLRHKRLSSQNQLVISRENYLNQRDKIRDFNFPIIVKPYRYGSSSAGVYLYNNVSKIEASIFDQQHYISGKKFESYIVQEFLQGDEYIVDSVSFKGEHIVTAIFKYEKAITNNRDSFFTGSSIIDPVNHVSKKIIQKIKEVFCALEIFNGVNHTEVILKNNGDIEIIEINPRLAGGSGSLLLMSQVYLGYGRDQYSVLFEKLGINVDAHCYKKYKFCKSFYLYSHNFTGNQFNKLFTEMYSDFKKLSFDRPKDSLTSTSKKFHNVRKIVVLADNELKNIETDMKSLQALEDV